MFSPRLRQSCDEYRNSHRKRLTQMVRAGESGVRVAETHARIVDGMLSALYCAVDAAAKIYGLAPGGRVALVAVGGYGRGLLGLQSDLDVMLLCDEPNDPGALRITEALLYPLWDLGLEIGHAVRGINETVSLAREDLRTATTLCDLRRVAGDSSIVEELLRTARRQIFEPALAEVLDALIDERDGRHERFGGTRYLLEPDVKHGVGGLRDFDIILWVANARWGARTLEEAVAAGAMLHREARELESARELFWQIRNHLHLRTNRRQDRLTFEDQEEIATHLGFVDTAAGLGVEEFMQAYYRQARVVEQSAERMLDRARPNGRKSRPVRLDLGDGTMVFDGFITLRDSDELQSDPALAMRLYRQVRRRRLPPYGFARDAVARAAADPGWCERLRDNDEAAELFLEHLAYLGEVPVRNRSMLRELHDVGLLLAMIPEFEPVTGRVHHDVYHVYTVDVHSVAAVDQLRATMRGELATTQRLATRLAADMLDPIPLLLAVLLHDVGKGRARDHSDLGAELARPICKRLGVRRGDVERVQWLVRDHLSLYHWAMRRDITDPATIEEVVRRVGTLQRLNELYLLTVVDLATTNPTAMTTWKAQMLHDLYLATAAWLERGPVGKSELSERAEEVRRQVAIGFVGDYEQDRLNDFVASMPDRYLLTNPVDVIRAHARVARDRGDRRLYVAALPGASTEFTELVVVTDDRAGLLADVAAVLASSRLDVVTAQISTRDCEGKREAFDCFQVRRRGTAGGEPVDPPTVARIQKELLDILEGKINAWELVARQTRPPPPWARRKSPAIKTQVLVDNEISPHATVIDVFTRDRVGLLQAIASTLHRNHLSIGFSKLSTEGERVVDVFYVTDSAGKKLVDPDQISDVFDQLHSAIELLDRF